MFETARKSATELGGMIEVSGVSGEDIFNGLFTDKLVDEKKTIKRAKVLLKEYKTIAQIARVTKEPSMTQSFGISEPRFSVGQLIGDPTEKNQISKAVEKQMVAQELVTDIINGVNNVYVKNGEPSAYYKRLLFVTYLDFKVRNHIDARVKLAKEFPNRIETAPNDVMLDEHIFYFDLNKALFAFANSYWSHETQSLLVYKDE